MKIEILKESRMGMSMCVDTIMDECQKQGYKVAILNDRIDMFDGLEIGKNGSSDIQNKKGKYNSYYKS